VGLLIVQISDLHLHDCPHPLTPPRCAELIAEQIAYLQRPNESVCVAVCGDLVTKGRSWLYESATAFLLHLKAALGSKPEFVLCPGNHDLDSESVIRRAFDGFQHTFWVLGQSLKFGEGTHVARQRTLGLEFVVANSAYHGNYSYGEVDRVQLEAELREAAASRLPIVLLVHHHLLPRDDDKCSAIWNADEVYRLALHYDVALILHGHVHGISVRVATHKRCALIGAGSLFGETARNTANQFNILRMDHARIKKVWACGYDAGIRAFRTNEVRLRTGQDLRRLGWHRLSSMAVWKSWRAK